MKKLNLKRIYLKNLNSFLLALYNPFLDSLNRLFKHVNSLITLMFVQCFSIIVKLGENFTTISQRLSWLFACIFYIHDGSAACSLINNNWRYFYSTSLHTTFLSKNKGKCYYSTSNKKKKEDNNVYTISINGDNYYLFSSLDQNFEFMADLISILRGLNSDKLYQIEYYLYLRTDDGNKCLLGIKGRDYILDSDESHPEFVNHVLSLSWLEKIYKYKGYYNVFTDSHKGEYLKDLKKYIPHVYNRLGEYVKSVNENLSEDGFIEFKKNTLVSVKCIDRDNNLSDFLDKNLTNKINNNQKVLGRESSIIKKNYDDLHKKSYNVSLSNIININSKRFYSTKKNIKSNNLFLFDQLKQILMNNPLNENTQIKIEKFLIDSNISKMDNDKFEFFEIISKFNKDLRDIFIGANQDLASLIQNFVNRRIYEVYESKNKLTKKELSSYYLSIILKDVPIEYVISIMLGKSLMIMSKHSQDKNNTATVFIELGEYLIDHYFYLLYKKERNNKMKNNLISDVLMFNLRDWKRDNKVLVDQFDNVAIHGIGALLIDWLRDVDLLEINIEKSLKENHMVVSVLKPTAKLHNTYKSVENKTPLMLPNKIPMIVKPKEYKRISLGDKKKYYEALGGYLLNGEYYSNEIIIKNWRSKINSSVEDINCVYRSINNISSVAYKINKSVLNFIKLNDYRLGLTLINKSHPLEEKILNGAKLSKWEKVEYDSFMSKKFVEQNVLGLADLFENIPEFFIPVRLDYRGRMYCESDYLNYQSTDLSKSLLIFSKPSKILKSDLNSINYLKLFGANCYGNKLDKKSFEDRLKWVNDNEKDIIDFNNGILISKAESKFLFIGFCVEYNRWLDCLENSETTHFYTYLPIQLDASCNGYQHISMLVQDIDLAQHLNLTKSSKRDVPNDFYTLISRYLSEFFISIVKKLEFYDTDKKINEELTKLGISKHDKKSFERLASLEIQRNIIKKAIMTIPYNASSIQLIKYLQEHFEYDDERTKLSNEDLNLDDVNYLSEDLLEGKFSESHALNKGKNLIWYKHRKNPNIKLEQKDFLNMYKGLMHILNNIFPSLTSLSKYFKDVTSICTRFGLSIPWYLPTGLTANQSYLEIKETKVKPLNFSNIEFRLKILVKDKFDKDKQSRALMPNLIHSLDATSLVLLIDRYFYEFNSDSKNIYAIHDCFAVTANHMEYIMNTLKMVYISLYSNEGYLHKLDNDLIKYLKNHLGDDFSIEELLIEVPSNKPNIKPRKIKYPDINNVLKHTYNIQLVKASSYIIH